MLETRRFRTRAVGVGLVAACALATGWIRNKVNSAPDHLRETASFWELVRHKSPPPLNREQRRARARAALAAMAGEPVTGAPFHFNAGTRTLSMATDSQDRYDRVELPW